MFVFGFGLLFQLYVLCAIIWTSYELRKAFPSWLKSLQRLQSTLPLKQISVSKILLDIGASEDDPPCVYSWFNPGKTCGGKPSTGDASFAANSLYLALKSHDPHHTDTIKVLNDFAKYRLCHEHRRIMTTNNAEFWQRQLTDWLQELCQFYDQEANEIRAQHLPLDIPDSIETSATRHMLEDKRRARQESPDIPGCYPESQISVTDSRLVDRSSSSHDDFERRILERYGNYFSHTKSVAPSGASLKERFVPYTATSKSLLGLVRKQLTPRDSRRGSVYIFASKCEEQIVDPGYLKIGFTNGEVEARFNELESKCEFQCARLGTFETINAKRVESLVHKELELRGKRMKDQRCFNNSNKVENRCAVIHNEWFMITQDEAIDVVEYWVEWMKNDPYSDEGCLKPEFCFLMYSATPSDDGHIEDEQNEITAMRRKFIFDSKGVRWCPLDDVQQRPSASPWRVQRAANSRMSARLLENKASLSPAEGYQETKPSPSLAPTARKSAKRGEVLSPRAERRSSRNSPNKGDNDENPRSYEQSATNVETPVANCKARFPLIKSDSEPARVIGRSPQSLDAGEPPTPSRVTKFSRARKTRRTSDTGSSASSNRSAERTRRGKTISALEVKSLDAQCGLLKDQVEAEW